MSCATSAASEAATGPVSTGLATATSTVVVKSYAGGSLDSWARERVGLGVAGVAGLAPRLLASAVDPPLVVMEDLGSAPSVADHLLGTDPAAADHALVAWAQALGRLHARTHAGRDETRQAFAEAGPPSPAMAGRPFDPASPAPSTKATADWAANAELLGLSGPPDVEARRRVAGRLRSTTCSAPPTPAPTTTC